MKAYKARWRLKIKSLWLVFDKISRLFSKKLWPVTNLRFKHTVEPRSFGPPLSGTSIIRLGSFLVIRSENGRVPQTRMRVEAVTMETYLLIFCACAYIQPCGTAVYQ